MSKATTNSAASVRQRLANVAKTRGIEFQRILVLYAQERLLYRLSVSPFADRFILKGASLFSLWFTEPHRRTRDMDLLGKDAPNAEKFVSLFQSLCSLPVNMDGIVFMPDTVKARAIREGNDFGGLRITLTAVLDNARISVQIDIGYGDAAVPEPQEVEFPVLLDSFAAPRLLAYQKETSIAEKLHALVVLERSNSRMKDFFDIYVLSQEFSFNMERLSGAVRDAFERRGTRIPVDCPDGLTRDFADDAGKLSQWKAFLKQNVTAPRNTLSLADVVDAIALFLLPVLDTARDDSSIVGIWSPGGPWSGEVTH